MDVTLQNLNEVVLSWGRGLVLYAPVWTPGLGDVLTLTHLGDTEGNIAIATNPQIEKLTTPELTGPAAHEVDYMGEDPVVEIPLFLADPALIAICSPVGSAHAGTSMRRGVREHTLVIMPERLFIVTDPTTLVESRGTLSFTLGIWKLNGAVLTAAQQAYLDSSFWLWRGFFNRPPRTFHGGGGDAKKNIETVSFQGMQHPDMPEGHKLYTTGDPADSDIDIAGGS